MRKLLLLPLLAALALVGGKAEAATFFSCFGAPADYVLAFDTAGGRARDNKVDYEQPRWYNEQQTWATHSFEFPGHHSEHVHVGACIPNAQTMTKPFRMDMGYTFHNMDDYTISSASMSAVTQTGSRGLWAATPEQVAQLQAAADASLSGTPQKVYFSTVTTAPTTNGLKEIRGGIATVKDGANAVFEIWNTDARWYETDNYVGLPSSTPLPSQRAVRVRPIIVFNGKTDYHHSGWCGMNGNNGSSTLTGSPSWTATTVAKVWPDTAGKRICLYVTDGGGPATLMIDPDFHNHYDGPTASCPNVDAAGNCLGQWYWQPDNQRKELFGLELVEVTIPASVVASLAPGVHRLVFKSDDFAECVRSANFQHWNNCPPDVRGTWSNVSVLPFKVN